MMINLQLLCAFHSPGSLQMSLLILARIASLLFARRFACHCTRTLVVAPIFGSPVPQLVRVSPIWRVINAFGRVLKLGVLVLRSLSRATRVSFCLVRWYECLVEYTSKWQSKHMSVPL